MKNRWEIAVVIVSLVIIGGLVLYYLKSGISGRDDRLWDVTEVNNFEECAAAGNPVAESLPRQCFMRDGRSFSEDMKKEEPSGDFEPVDSGMLPEKACENKCGDGVCQEIVCLGTDCPCAETSEACPFDCPGGNN